MERLLAKFLIELEYPLLVKRSITDKLRYKLFLDRADIQLVLIPAEDKGKLKNERIWTYEVYNMEIIVSLPETQEPPLTNAIARDGKESYHEIKQYFNARSSEFREIAIKVFQRVTRFFKYRQGTPYFTDKDYNFKEFLSPIWYDENGQEIWKSELRAVFVPYRPGFLRSELGIKTFRKKDDKRLIKAIEKDYEVALYEEILSDAQTALLRNNLRRGILEMAIACEIAIKQTYIIDLPKGPLINLIHKEAEHTFGESFETVNETAYTHIDYLFRCRNQIAHRGVPGYRDNNQRWQEPQIDTIKQWWESVEELLRWLRKKGLKKR